MVKTVELDDPGHAEPRWDRSLTEVGMVGVGRGVGVVAAAMVALLLGAGSAMAHVEARVEPATAGARDAVVTFTAEAESDSAGISSVQVQLPDGIAPGEVTLANGPAGWALTPGVDGYTVAGPPLPVGAELGYAITVKQLPNAESVAFKTTQSYTDGTTDRWIGLPGPDGAQPENPAPMVTLAPAAGGLPPSSSPGPTSSATASAEADAQQADPTDSGGPPVLLWVGLAVVVVAGLVFVVLRRRARR